MASGTVKNEIENKSLPTMKNNYIKVLEGIFEEISKSEVEEEEPVRREINIKDFADKDIILKTVLIGDGAVGKTSIRNSFMGKRFQPTYMATIGADFAVKDVKIHGDKSVKFQIWDLAGQQRFDVIRDSYYLGAHVAMIVFDHTRPESFSNIVKWMNELWINNGAGPIPFIVLGNKTDLIPLNESRKLNITARSFALGISRTTEKNYNFSISYLPTSAKTGENIDKAFKELVINFLLWKGKKQ